MLRFDAHAVIAAAGQVESAGTVLAVVDVASPFAQVSDALPGSQVAQSCLWISTRLGAAVQVYAEGLGVLGQNLRATAADLAATDDAVSASMGHGVPR